MQFNELSKKYFLISKNYFFISKKSNPCYKMISNFLYQKSTSGYKKTIYFLYQKNQILDIKQINLIFHIKKNSPSFLYQEIDFFGVKNLIFYISKIWFFDIKK